MVLGWAAMSWISNSSWTRKWIDEEFASSGAKPS